MRRLPALSLLALALAPHAWAQEQAGAPAVAPYQDRVIDPSALQALPPDEDDPGQRNAQGLPRSVSVEASWGTTTEGSHRYDESGLGINGFLSTPRWGDFSITGTLSRDSEDGKVRNSLTLWQRNLRFDHGWSMDNGVGVLSSPTPELMREQYRFFLPSSSMQGVQTQLTQGDGRVQLQAGVGRPGVFEGTRLAGFDPRSGQISTVAGQADVGKGWTVGGGVMDARVTPERGDRANWDFLYDSSKSAYGAVAWEGPRDRYQANVLGSRADGVSGQGAWLEGLNSRGRYTHRYGVFYLDPGIAWGLAPINNDLKGVYYRLGYQYGRWDWNAGLDSLRSISGNGVDGWFATGYGRYQASRTLGLGASGSARENQGQMAGSVSVFGDKRFAKTQVRLQLDAADDGSGTRDTRIGVDNAFTMQGSNRLAVNLAYAQTRGNPEWDGSQTSLSVYGGRDLTDTLSLDGTVRWTTSTGGAAVRGGDANVGLNWRPNNRWVLSANYYRSEGTQRTPFDLDPIVPVDRRMNLPRSSSVYFNLRYDWGAGRPSYVVGGAPGTAVGSIRGTVFLDDNRNGQRDANEQPVANVTVTVDGRYSVRTDANGRYEFPLVATGSHEITVVADTLPLPWSFDQPQQTITVGTRSDVELDVGATRPL